ncbi:hypothetical protein Fmac_021632 [Flemingia macrophylla]|uniref:MADS-box domain-containing protein n=1 Tax=Flemingia macrophylla TaxID=520843 RepID=A0ABD1LZ84_9FABA
MASCGANAATATTSNMKRQNKHYATFCKRKQGLFNKLTELSLLCNVETALFIVSPNDKLYSCGYPNADYVLRRYLCTEKTPQRVNRARFLSKARLSKLNL